MDKPSHEQTLAVSLASLHQYIDSIAERLAVLETKCGSCEGAAVQPNEAAPCKPSNEDDMNELVGPRD